MLPQWIPLRHAIVTWRTYLCAALRQRETSRYNPLTIDGWRMLHADEREQARHNFRAALDDDSCDIGAWIGLSRAVDTREERCACLHTAIALRVEARHGHDRTVTR